LSWQLGAMGNLGGRSALGATAVLRSSFSGTLIGVEPRYRYWASRTLAVDLAAAIMRYTEVDPERVRSPLYGLSAGLNLADWAALTANVQMSRLRGGGWDVAFFPGIRLGAYAGLTTGVLLPVGASVAYMATIDE
jgi:hypothetical protein